MRELQTQTTLRLTIGLLIFIVSPSVLTTMAQTMSGGKYTITSSVVAGGGGTSTGSGNKTIEGTSGQAAAGGPHSQSPYAHEAGFWPTALSQPAGTPTPTPTPVPTPSLSINDLSQAEGNSGTSSFSFSVSLSAASNQTVTVNYTTADGTALSGSDYQPASGLLTFNPGETSKPVTILVNGNTQVEANKTFFVNLSNPVNAGLSKAQGVGTIINDDNVPPPQVQFNQASYSVQEDLIALSVTVTRTGDSSAAAAVDYSTVDGTAKQKGDFEYAAGRLQFAPGETSKTVTLLINEDMYVEGAEGFTLALSNPSGVTLGPQSTTTITITDDAPESPTNPIDEVQAFVWMQYHDFLNREPDAPGLAFWMNEITSCGGDPQCIEAKRVNVSAAFFLSIEYQETGYLVHRMYKAAYGNLPNSPVPVKVSELLPDTQEIGKGVIVKQAGWQQVLETNKQTFTTDFVQRTRFVLAYPLTLTPSQFVDALFANAGVVPSAADRQTAIAEFGGAVNTLDTGARARALRRVAENQVLTQQEFNRAFVLMQYMGYLRRNPVDAPEPLLNYDGYNFWLNKLNAFNGNYLNAEMVKAFITSIEYRQRFGP